MIQCLQAIGIPGLQDPRGKQTLERREFPSSSAMKGKEKRKCLVQIFLSREEANCGSSHCRIFVPSITQDEKVICRRWDWELREVRKIWKRSGGQCGRKASTLIEKSELPIRSEASGGTSQLTLAWIRFRIFSSNKFCFGAETKYYMVNFIRGLGLERYEWMKDQGNEGAY